MSLERRIQCLEVQVEYQRIYAAANAAGQSLGLSADAILTEARRIFSLSEDEQWAARSRTYAELDDDQARELDAIRHRHAAILRRTP
jgi:hypothetical protein